ncbi:MAG TPA: Tad domain-containing protein, partial [Candidatus Rifleibacterium sp.]|nr:Tad domain-containing protein [Candidatus Rifleibacterium sp.]
MNNAVKNRAGSIMLMTVAFGVFLLSMTALVTDVGYLYYNQARLQTAVNAGWKAGYDKMMEIKGSGSPILSSAQKQTVRQHILEVIKSNGYTDEQLASL